VSWPSSPRLLLGQIRYQLLIFWRIPVGMFFTLAFPLILLLLFNALFGDETVEIEGGDWPVSQFYTGGLAAFAAVSATYTNLANSVPIRREEGILKRWRSTPLPTSIYIGGFVGSALVIALLGAVLMLGIGFAFYDLQVEAAKVPGALVMFVVGVSAFAALGMAVASLVPTASAAAAVANATILPLSFISNVFIATGDDAPEWMTTVGNLFPLRPFVVSIQDSFNPFVEAPAIDWARIGFVALWGLAGLVVALRCFRWDPNPSGTTTRRRRQRDS
jgi:ABC-2 type transport system permease protein